MGLRQMVEVVFPPVSDKDPGTLARVLVMEIQDLFDSADQPTREYIAWRMSQVTNDMVDVVRSQSVPVGHELRPARAAA